MLFVSPSFHAKHNFSGLCKFFSKTEKMFIFSAFPSIFSLFKNKFLFKENILMCFRIVAYDFSYNYRNYYTRYPMEEIMFKEWFLQP